MVSTQIRQGHVLSHLLPPKPVNVDINSQDKRIKTQVALNNLVLESISDVQNQINDNQVVGNKTEQELSGTNRVGAIGYKIGMVTLFEKQYANEEDLTNGKSKIKSVSTTVLKVIPNVVVRTRWDGKAGSYMVDVAAPLFNKKSYLDTNKQKENDDTKIKIDENAINKISIKQLKSSKLRANLFHLRRWGISLINNYKNNVNKNNNGLIFYSPRSTASFKVTPDSYLKTGNCVTCNHFVPGQFLDVVGKTTARGFAGVMKRHGYHGNHTSHGTTKVHRKPGSIGQQTPGRVLKGKPMPGRIRSHNHVQRSCRILAIDNEKGLIYISGSVPGPVGKKLLLKDSMFQKHKGTLFPKNSKIPFPNA